MIIGGGGEDGEGISTILCSDVVHRSRCDTSAGAFQRQVVAKKMCQGARAVSVQALYLTTVPIVLAVRTALSWPATGRLPLLVASSRPIGRFGTQDLPDSSRPMPTTLSCSRLPRCQPHVH